MRRALKIVAVLALLFVAYVAYWFYEDGRAHAAAAAFCDSIAVGSPMSAAADKLGGMSDVRHGFLQSESTYFASFRGPIFNAYTCKLTIDDGKVASKAVVEPED